MSAVFEKAISSRRVRRKMMYLIVTALSGGFMSMPAEGRPVTPSVSYKDIARPELIAQYKRAYAAAGFDFVSETTADGGYSVHVEFNFRVPEFPQKTEGGYRFPFGCLTCPKMTHVPRVMYVSSVSVDLATTMLRHKLQ